MVAEALRISNLKLGAQGAARLQGESQDNERYARLRGGRSRA